MTYESTITSKGTITIAAPLRKALGLKPGQKVRLSINKKKHVEIDAGISIEEFEKQRERILRKKKLPAGLKGLTARKLKDIAAEEMTRK